jgi:hypothetical protein
MTAAEAKVTQQSIEGVTQPSAREEREWKRLCQVAAEEWGGSSEEMESLFEYRLNNEVMHDRATKKIQEASEFLTEKENSISATQTIRIIDEVESAMCHISDLVTTLLKRQGLSYAGVYYAMHHELEALSDEITAPEIRETKAPLFPA